MLVAILNLAICLLLHNSGSFSLGGKFRILFSRLFLMFLVILIGCAKRTQINIEIWSQKTCFEHIVLATSCCGLAVESLTVQPKKTLKVLLKSACFCSWACDFQRHGWSRSYILLTLFCSGFFSCSTRLVSSVDHGQIIKEPLLHTFFFFLVKNTVTHCCFHKSLLWHFTAERTSLQSKNVPVFAKILNH